MTAVSNLSDGDTFPITTEAHDAVSAFQEVFAAPVPKEAVPFRFLNLPAEVREIVYDYYLRHETRIAIESGIKHASPSQNICLHDGWYNGHCCYLHYPDALKLCDRCFRRRRIRPENALDIVRPAWAPPLATLNAQLRDEVAHVILRTTRTISVNHSIRSHAVKRWFPRYLTSLCNSKVSAFDYICTIPLRTIRSKGPFSFLSRNFRHGIPNNEETWRDAHDNDAKVPHDFFRLFALQGLLECAELKQVMFSPAIVYSRYLKGDCRAPKTLMKFGTWLHEGFQKKGWDIEIRLRDEGGLEYMGKDEELIYGRWLDDDILDEVL